jgi:hypothetical protein
MMFVVQLSHGLSQRFDTGRRTVLASMARNVYLLGPLEASLDLVVNLRGALSQIGPCFRFLEVAVLIGTLRGPYDTSRGTGGIETGVGLVAFVGAELTMDLRGELWEVRVSLRVVEPLLYPAMAASWPKSGGSTKAEEELWCSPVSEGSLVEENLLVPEDFKMGTLLAEKDMAGM